MLEEDKFKIKDFLFSPLFFRLIKFSLELTFVKINFFQILFPQGFSSMWVVEVYTMYFGSVMQCPSWLLNGINFSKLSVSFN